MRAVGADGAPLTAAAGAATSTGVDDADRVGRSFSVRAGMNRSYAWQNATAPANDGRRQVTRDPPNVAATGVTVFSTISKGARFVSASGATCTAVKGKDAGVSCDLGSIASGDITQFTMVVRAGRAPVSVTSTVSSGATDPVSANDSDTEATAIAP